MRAYLFLILFSASMLVSAQSEMLMPETSIHTYYNPAMGHAYSNSRYEVSGVLDLYGGSTALPVGMSSKFLLGGEIDTDLKDKGAGKLKDDNRGGFDSRYGVWFSSAIGPADDQKSRIHVGVEQVSHTDFFFTEDLYHLVFYGNAAYTDRTAILDGSQYESKNYMAYKLAYSRQFSLGKNQITGAIGMGYLQGLAANELEITRGSIYTAPDATYLNLDYAFIFNTTGSKATKISNPRGASFSGDVAINFQNEDASWMANLVVADIGVFEWNDENNALYTGDTSTVYEGIDITNIILGIQDAGMGNEDLLLTYIDLDSSAGNFSTVTPARFDFNVTHFLPTNNIWMNAGVHQLLAPNYSPLFYVRGGKLLQNGISSANAVVSVGGYGGFGIGGGYSRQFGEIISASIQSPNILGFILPGTFNVTGIQLSVRASL